MDILVYPLLEQIVRLTREKVLNLLVLRFHVFYIIETSRCTRNSHNSHRRWKRTSTYATAPPNSSSSNLKTEKMASSCSIPMKLFGSLRKPFRCCSTKAAPPLQSICRMSSHPESWPRNQFVGNSDNRIKKAKFVSIQYCSSPMLHVEMTPQEMRRYRTYFRGEEIWPS